MFSHTRGGHDPLLRDDADLSVIPFLAKQRPKPLSAATSVATWPDNNVVTPQHPSHPISLPFIYNITQQNQNQKKRKEKNKTKQNKINTKKAKQVPLAQQSVDTPNEPSFELSVTEPIKITPSFSKKDKESILNKLPFECWFQMNRWKMTTEDTMTTNIEYVKSDFVGFVLQMIEIEMMETQIKQLVNLLDGYFLRTEKRIKRKGDQLYMIKEKEPTEPQRSQQPLLVPATLPVVAQQLPLFEGPSEPTLTEEDEMTAEEKAQEKSRIGNQKKKGL